MIEFELNLFFKGNFYKREYDHIYFSGNLWLDTKNRSYGEIRNGESVTDSFNYQKVYYKKNKTKWKNKN